MITIKKLIVKFGHNTVLGLRLKKITGNVLSNRKRFVHCAKGKGEGFSEAGIK